MTATAQRINTDVAEAYASFGLFFAVRDYLEHRDTDRCQRTRPLRSWEDKADVDRTGCYHCNALDRAQAIHARVHDYDAFSHHVRRWQAMRLLDRHNVQPEPVVAA